MGSTIGPPIVRTITSAILTFVALIAVACLAFAQSGDFSERDLTPPQRAHSAAAARAAHAPAKRVQAAAYSDEQNGNQEDTDEGANESDQSDQRQTAQGAPAASAGEPDQTPAAPADEPDQTPAVAAGGDLSYVIHEGDSVGAIASMFHLSADEIFHRNHINEHTTLHVGQVLRIPNPYVAQVRDLQKQITVLDANNQEQARKLEDSNSKVNGLDARISELTGINSSLEHDVKVLPWWRRATTIAATLAIVMFGITLLSLLQWFLIRLSFAAVADANERLTKLDQRYRVLMARAELRLQQLYGRRRATADSAAQSRGQEEFELESLSRELKDVLEREMSRLGVPRRPSARRSRLREWLAGLGSPVAVRSDRR
jgi:LysM repeat protein